MQEYWDCVGLYELMRTEGEGEDLADQLILIFNWFVEVLLDFLEDGVVFNVVVLIVESCKL